jgi:hypothetical protein
VGLLKNVNGAEHYSRKHITGKYTAVKNVLKKLKEKTHGTEN